eukprot:TRINITY_DN30455_c0_g1_i1.p1 TRINITY_DN30455_c0_g1~~TRINITY_DN30455_c0_g1_i1.p1  ORF type:complete len:549 (+),score=104.95 TRINITY_DN30455_c0_g1_i1:76-1722(+)
MLRSIDQALAGAIDIIADDVTATVKSVKEQGVMRTLGDAVEDAAGLVTNGARSAVSGLIGQRGPDRISSHSGISTGYADLCAPGRPGFNGGGGAAFPYVPNPSSGNSRAGWFSGSKSNAPKTSNVGSFAPGIGISLPGQGLPGMQGGMPVYGGGPPPPPSIAPYAGPGAGGAASAGAFRPPVPFSQGPGAGGASTAGQFRPPMPFSAPGPAANSTPSYASPPAPSSSSTSGGKEGTLPADELARRIEVIVGREAANQRCFDCGSHDHEWASVSFGILLCITCAGHHRRLGTHISRIRSCKMDSWTERQLQVFDSGGNQRLAHFFQANKVPDSPMYQRYSSPAGEWYREAWIKNRTLGREVPSPLQGVVVGPCIDDSKPANSTSQAKPDAPPVDLLDFGGETQKTNAPTNQTDLLAFGGGDPAASPAQSMPEADLLGVGEPVSSHTGSNADDLLGLGPTAVNAQPSAAAALSSLDFGTPTAFSASAVGAAPAMGAATQVAAPAAAMQGGQTFAPLPLERTLGGGAKLAEPAKEQKADDPFAMALKQWAM